MGVLSGLEPKKVFEYFEQICGIPHGSGNVEQISDFLVAFAKERGIFCIQDELKNVIMIKEATPGYEQEPAVILQGHMDMVAVKKPDCDIDMKTEGLRLAIDGDKVYAQGTSLGGDDGIAVAYALAILDDDTLKHPRLEVIITVDEEVGMDGARAIDLSMLKGNRMLNLDSEEEGIFLTSCAGGARVDCRLVLQQATKEGVSFEVTVKGLLGGHSGAEIHKERGNSNVLMARLLWKASQSMEVGLIDIKGGLADNAIPRQTDAVVVVKEADANAFRTILHDEAKKISEELATKDPDFALEIQEIETGSFACVSGEGTARGAAFVLALPNGIQAMSADMPGLVETSLNLGILDMQDGEIHAEFAARSSVESAKQALVEKMQAVTALAGGTCVVSGDYPGWKYRVDSPLRTKMIALYEKMYGTAPKVEAIHAGLECGLLAAKINDLDCVSIGPDMSDIHTTEESLSIASTKRVWEFVTKLLEQRDV